MIELKSVRQALLVSEHMSFRRAASALGVRPSAVSRRVRALEDEVGVSFFERHNGGVRVTTAGRWFLERAHAALCELDYAVKSAMKAGQGAEGFLRIGIFSSLASLFPRLAIGAFVALWKYRAASTSAVWPRQSSCPPHSDRELCCVRRPPAPPGRARSGMHAPGPGCSGEFVSVFAGLMRYEQDAGNLDQADSRCNRVGSRACRPDST